MSAAGFALREREGSRLVYRAATAHPRAQLLRDLVKAPPDAAGGPRPGVEDDDVRGWLREAGAPLWAPHPKRQAASLEELVTAGVALAHRDATVALVLPVLLHKQRGRLEHERLVDLARRKNEAQALGFFLELTGRLAGDRQLVARARALRDKRRTRPRLFFARKPGRYGLELERRNTPPLARRWGYYMNMPLESFAAAFAKY